MRHCGIVLHMPDRAPLLTAPEVANLLGKSVRSVHRMATAGTLPVAHKLPGPNGAFLFARADVEALAAERVA